MCPNTPAPPKHFNLKNASLCTHAPKAPHSHLRPQIHLLPEALHVSAPRTPPRPPRSTSANNAAPGKHQKAQNRIGGVASVLDVRLLISPHRERQCVCVCVCVCACFSLFLHPCIEKPEKGLTEWRKPLKYQMHVKHALSVMHAVRVMYKYMMYGNTRSIATGENEVKKSAHT